MLLRQPQQKIPQPVQQFVPQQTTQATDSQYEFFGDPILPLGPVELEELPAGARELIARIDVDTLPLNAEYKQIIAAIQNETLENLTLKGGVDLESVPVQKITSITQLTPEQQSLLSTVLKDIKSATSAANVPASDGSGSRSFSSDEALFRHVRDKLLTADAVSEVDADSAPAVQPSKPLFSNTTQQTEQQPEPATVPSKPPEGMVRCPHCDMNLYLDPLEITATQKKDFLHSVMHNQPYKETHYYFGGNIQVTFKSLSVYEQDFLTNVVAHINERSDVSEKDKCDFYARGYTALSVTSFSIGCDDTTFSSINTECTPAEGVDLVLARCNNIICKIYGNEMLGLLCSEALRFNFRYRRLVAMGFNPDFWKPIQ